MGSILRSGFLTSQILRPDVIYVLRRLDDQFATSARFKSNIMDIVAAAVEKIVDGKMASHRVVMVSYPVSPVIVY